MKREFALIDVPVTGVTIENNIVRFHIAGSAIARFMEVHLNDELINVLSFGTPIHVGCGDILNITLQS